MQQNQPPSSGVDTQTAQRLRSEWEQVKSALNGQQVQQIEDPLGEDGTLNVQMSFFKHNGGGEVLFRKGDTTGDHRYTRFRAWGPNGADFIEKSSYLVKANGHKEFHKRRLELSDTVVVTHEMDGEDAAWASSLA
jgi:hypothetical protein